MTYRVVQWTTGNVGKQSIEAIVAHPDLELVGCYAWSPDKAGKDSGEMCGLPATGILATNDVEQLLALQPACVVYNPMWPDVSEMVRILESGINIVTTAAFITGHSLGEDRLRIIDACKRGNTSVFGSGINPGFANLIAIAAANGCNRINKITVSETADITGYDSPATELPVGFGRPINDPDLLAMTTAGTAIFEDAVRMIGEALGLDFDEVVCEAQYAQTTKDLDLGSWSIAAGCVAGIAASWHGKINGRSIVELRIKWRKGQSLEPDWDISTGYLIEVDGNPRIRTRVEVLPPRGFKGQTFNEFMVLGMITTAMPAINAIAKVVAAAPGIVTYNDILPQPRGLVALSA